MTSDVTGQPASPTLPDVLAAAPEPADRQARPHFDWLTAKLSRKVQRIGFATAVVALGGALIGAAPLIESAISPPPPPPPPSATPIVPVEIARADLVSPTGPSVPDHFFPAGTFSGLAPGDQIWLLNIPRSTGRLFPQGQPCAKYPNGSFTCAEYFLGGESDAGKIYELILVVANAHAVDAFLRYDIEEGDEYRGMPAMPSGASILDQLTVTRE